MMSDSFLRGFFIPLDNVRVQFFSLLYNVVIDFARKHKQRNYISLTTFFSSNTLIEKRHKYTSVKAHFQLTRYIPRGIHMLLLEAPWELTLSKTKKHVSSDRF